MNRFSGGKLYFPVARIAGLIAVLLAWSFSPYSVAFAASSSPTKAEEVTAQRINIAGRQRMLTQRMVKSMCLSLLHVHNANHSAVAFQAADEFDETLTALIEGDPARGLLAEGHPPVRAKLEEVKVLAKGLTPSVRQVAAGDVQSVAISLVLRRNLPVLAEMNAAVGMIEKHREGRSLSPLVATTINKAGRQRMLSQRIAKNLCFTTIGLAPAASRAALAADIETFGRVLSGLMQGDATAGLQKAPTRQIAGKLGAVKYGWATILPILQKVADGGEVKAVELMQVDLQIDTILKTMNEAVNLWSREAG